MGKEKDGHVSLHKEEVMEEQRVHQPFLQGGGKKMAQCNLGGKNLQPYVAKPTTELSKDNREVPTHTEFRTATVLFVE